MRQHIAITLALLCVGVFCQVDRVLMTDVRTLTLRRGKLTTGRRSSPVQQLQCVGGGACSSHEPEVVQCTNMGSDGYEIQWECNAELEDRFKFGQITVSCEGWNDSRDPYILRGSCGLEYELIQTRYDDREYNSRSSAGDYGQRYSPMAAARSSSFGWSTILFLAVVLFLLVKLCLPSSSQQGHNNAYAQGGAYNSGSGGGGSGGGYGNANASGNGGWGGGMGGGWATGATGPTDYSNPSCGNNNPPPQAAPVPPQQQGWGGWGNFLGGAAVGYGLNSIFNRRPYHTGYNNGYSFGTTSGFRSSGGGSSFTSRSSGGGSVRTARAFGGTRNR